MLNILSESDVINSKHYSDLFSSDEQQIKKKYRELARMYHPDTYHGGADAHSVFEHINTLHSQALEALRLGSWCEANSIYFKCEGTSDKKLTFLKEGTFECGRVYIANTVVAYVFDEKFVSLYNNALSRISNLKYSSTKMLECYKPLMPSIVAHFKTTSGEYVLILRKSSNEFRLSDILSYYNGSLPDRHAAWIMSRLCNIACYVEFSGLSHNGVTLDNCFISPTEHSLKILGGWWCCVGADEKMICTTSDVLSVMPIKVKTSKLGSIQTDIESIKSIGRKITACVEPPEPFKLWLNKGAANKAYDEYSSWEKTLDASYGERKFVNMDVSVTQIYK